MDRFSGNSGDAPEIVAYLDRVDYLSRGLHQHQAALALLDDVPRHFLQLSGPLPARMRVERAAIFERQEMYEEAAQLYSEALEMLSGTQRLATLGDCIEGLARCKQALGQTEEAYPLWMQALEVATQRDNAAAQERVHRRLGQVLEGGARRSEAEDHYIAALELGRVAENWAGVIADLARLADIAAQLGEPEQQQQYATERHHLLTTLRDLAYVGRGASPREEAIQAAQDLLPEIEAALPQGDRDLEAEADEAYQQATALRKAERYQASLPPYHTAIACWLALDQPHSLIAGLNGLGLTYRGLARQAFAQEFLSVAEAEELVNPYRPLVWFRDVLCRTRGYTYAEKAGACHRWALEVCKVMDYYIGQANQISNLAVVEELFGNLDTARRYQRWAAQVHRQTGQYRAAAEDLGQLATLERRLGDEAAAVEWERQAQEVLGDE